MAEKTGVKYLLFRKPDSLSGVKKRAILVRALVLQLESF